MIHAFEGKTPEIGDRSYVHPGADLIGNVKVGSGCWIGPGVRIRGDYGSIVIGNNTSIEDNCVIHAGPGEKTTIGDWVTIGHGAIVHGATVHDWAVIGMGSVVSDMASIGDWAVVGEGAVVPHGHDIPDDRIAVGVPAHLMEKQVASGFKTEWTCFKKAYVDLAWRYHTALT